MDYDQTWVQECGRCGSRRTEKRGRSRGCHECGHWEDDVTPPSIPRREVIHSSFLDRSSPWKPKGK